MRWQVRERDAVFAVEIGVKDGCPSLPFSWADAKKWCLSLPFRSRHPVRLAPKTDLPSTCGAALMPFLARSPPFCQRLMPLVAVLQPPRNHRTAGRPRARAATRRASPGPSTERYCSSGCKWPTKLGLKGHGARRGWPQRHRSCRLVEAAGMPVRHFLCLVLPPPSRLRHRFCLVCCHRQRGQDTASALRVATAFDAKTLPFLAVVLGRRAQSSRRRAQRAVPCSGGG